MTAYLKLTIIVASLFSILTVIGCGSSIERINSQSITDLNGDWNDTDSRLVAEEMVKDLLSRQWFTRFDAKMNRVPAVIVGTIRNLSHEHINTTTFINDIQKELINSGRIDFVASRTERKELRTERLEQDANASEATRKSAGQEIGADFMLQGSINSIVDVGSSTEQVRFYQVDLTLINLVNNRKVWLGQKKIKKAVNKESVRF